MKAQMKKVLYVLTVGLFCVNSVAASLSGRISSIIERSSQKKVEFGICVVKADAEKTIYDYNSGHAMIPASNMKLIITAAALKFLGPAYVYKTNVGLCGNDLIVAGSGDPLLGDKKTDTENGRKRDWIFEDIINHLRSNNISAVNDIVIDSSIFDEQYVHPNWPKEQLNRWYACEISGLNYNGNCVDLSVQNNGGRVNIFVEPQTNFVKFINKVKAIKSGSSSIGSYRTNTPNKIIVFGKCKKKQGPIFVAIENMPIFFGHLLGKHLQKAGIEVGGQIVKKPLDITSGFQLLTQYRTPISQCIKRCNKDSFGLAAEALLKTMSAEMSPNGKHGSWVGGRQIIGHYLSKLGIEKSQFYIDDASGLSRESKLSARAITTVLSNTYKKPLWKIYSKSLAVGGVNGSGPVRKYFKEPKYRGKIFAKSGTINRVKSLSGVCRTLQGDFIFSILANNANAGTRKAINDIVKAIIDAKS